MTLVAVFGLSIASASPAAAATTHHVTISPLAYCVEGDCSNHTLTISPGDTVVWTNADPTCNILPGCLHTAFNSPLIPGATRGVSFSSPGTFTYTCAFIRTMSGAIVVRPAAPQVVLNSLPLVIPHPRTLSAALPGAHPGSGSASSTPQGTPDSRAQGTTQPGAQPSSGSAWGFPSDLPIGISLSVTASELPNTFLPSLPFTGRGPSPRIWMLLELAAAFGIVSAALLGLRLATQRR